MNMDLNLLSGQQEAIDMIIDWYSDNKKQVFFIRLCR